MHREMRGRRGVSSLSRGRLGFETELNRADSRGSPRRMHCNHRIARVSSRRGASEDVSVWR